MTSSFLQGLYHKGRLISGDLAHLGRVKLTDCLSYTTCGTATTNPTKNAQQSLWH